MTGKFLTASALAMSVACAAGVSPVSAALLDFEFGGTYTKPYDNTIEGRGWNELDNLNSGSKVYGGLEWLGDWEVQSADSIEEFYNSTASFPSGNEAAYNGDGDTPMRAEAFAFSAFQLGNAEFRAWPWYDGTDWGNGPSQSATDITITGFLNGDTTDSVNVAGLAASDWTTVSLAQLGTIDAFEIGVNSENTQWWMMDDIEVITDGIEVKSVPLPASFLLLISAVGCLFGARCFNNRQEA